MPWLTPDSIPEDDDCRPLFIPANSVWLALVSGALTELTQKYNWEKFGTLSVDETVAQMQIIVDGYYNTACLNCTFPDGGAIIRINQHGVLQQLDGSGNWTEPTGDYVIPPPDARSGGTSVNQNCLAAKNATNVLKELYTNLSMSFASNLSAAEAATSFVGALVALIGFEFAPITTGIVIFFEAVFQLLYQALAYITADLWTDAFTNQLTCFLLACAVNTAGVVTFDWDCFVAKLNSTTDEFGLSEVQLRLYLQVSYLLYFIGGVSGLNLAGGTTAITDDDCSDCGCCDTFNVTYFAGRGDGIPANPTTLEPGGTYTFYAGEFPGFPGSYSIAFCLSCCMKITAATSSGSLGATNHVLCGGTGYYHGELVGECFQRINYGGGDTSEFSITLTFDVTDCGCGEPSTFGCEF